MARRKRQDYICGPRNNEWFRFFEEQNALERADDMRRQQRLTYIPHYVTSSSTQER